jgi:chromosome segregation ATPase
MQVGFLEILGLVGGTSGLTAVIQWLITANSQRKKEGAFANQEIAKVDQEKATALDKTGDIYFKLTQHVDKVLLETNSKIEKVEKENIRKEELLKKIIQQNQQQSKELAIVKDENEKLKQQVSTLNQKVDTYKKKCENCQFTHQESNN